MVAAEVLASVGRHIAHTSSDLDRTTRTILITGCSSGIGHHAAHGLKERGWRVFAAARKPADVTRLADEGLESVLLDYADEPSIAAGLAEVLGRTGGRLDALFNNGGFAQAGAIEDIDTAMMRAQFQANFFGWHDLTRQVIPVMRRQGHGRLVFCSSVLGFVGARYRGAYVASKYAIEGYADTLRAELHGTGIAVVLIEPGPITSNFRINAIDNISRTIDIDASIHGRFLSPRPRRSPKGAYRHAVPTRAGRGIEAADSRARQPQPSARYRVTIPTHIGAVLKRMLPTRAMDRIVRGGRASRSTTRRADPVRRGSVPAKHSRARTKNGGQARLRHTQGIAIPGESLRLQLGVPVEIVEPGFVQVVRREQPAVIVKSSTVG